MTKIFPETFAFQISKDFLKLLKQSEGVPFSKGSLIEERSTLSQTCLFSQIMSKGNWIIRLVLVSTAT